MPVFAMRWLETGDLAPGSLFVGGERQLVKRHLQLQSDELRHAYHCFIVILFFSYEPKELFLPNPGYVKYTGYARQSLSPSRFILHSLPTSPCPGDWPLCTVTLPSDLRPWTMLTTGETQGAWRVGEKWDGGIYFSTLSPLGLRCLAQPCTGVTLLWGASPPCYSPSSTTCSRCPFRPRGGKNHPQTLVPGESNIPSLMHFNPAHVSTK